MKKLFTILSLMGAVIFTSCDNDNSVNPQPTGTATVKGTVFAQFKYPETGENEFETVNNTKVIMAIYDGYNGEEYESVRFVETTTDASGNYSFDIEIGNKPLYVELRLVDFKQTVEYTDGSEEETFYGDWFFNDAMVAKGGVYIRDIYYGS